MCVILSARKGVAETEDPTLVDKSAILCSLNIKSMTFDDTVGLLSKNTKMPGNISIAWEYALLHVHIKQWHYQVSASFLITFTVVKEKTMTLPVRLNAVKLPASATRL